MEKNHFKMSNEKLEKKMKELFQFTNDKKIGILAIQQISKEGYIECVPMFRDLEVYPEVIEAEKVEVGVPTNPEFLPEDKGEALDK